MFIKFKLISDRNFGNLTINVQNVSLQIVNGCYIILYIGHSQPPSILFLGRSTQVCSFLQANAI